MRRKKLTLALSLLSCLALIGVGFAAWIITSDASAEAQGNITVDTVTDNRLNIKTSWLDNNSSIIFGWKEASTTYSWLKNTDNSYKEKLTVTLVVNVKDKNEAPIDPESITAKITADEAYNTALTNELVGALPVLTATKQEIGVYHVVITFTWGTEFESKNPLEYYNNQAYTPELANEAVANLESLESLKDANFTITLTVTPKEPAVEA